MRLDLHGLGLEFTTDSDELAARWRALGESWPVAGSAEAPALRVDFRRVAEPPEPPPGPPAFAQEAHLRYYLAGTAVVAYFPRYARIDIDLARANVQGALAPAALTAGGVFEDLVAIALGPFLRRRGLFPVHAFAAAHAGRALLLVGERGSGKTTTGLSLLRAGWRLLANDAPLLAHAAPPASTPDDERPAGIDVLAYPGLLSAHPDALARFPELAPLVPAGHPPERKLAFSAESLFPGSWLERAPAAAVCFPRVTAGPPHALARMPAPEALRRLLPNAIDRWDTATIAGHLAALGALVQAAPAYELRLGPRVEELPERLAALVAGEPQGEPAPR
jgi:hypothetical protein